MSMATNDAENYILNAMFGKVTFPTITNLYAAAFRADPGDAGTLTSEVSNSLNYSRVTLTPIMSSASNGTIPLATDLVFPIASGAWGVIGWLGAVDTSTYGQGRVWARVSMGATVQIDAGESLRFQASQLTFTCD